MAKDIAVKKYVVKLSDEEREQLTALIHTGRPTPRKTVKDGATVKSR
ncbi:MAG: hypothetical protein ABSE69_15105 [Roseiarcus sp.]